MINTEILSESVFNGKLKLNDVTKKYVNDYKINKNSIKSKA